MVNLAYGDPPYIGQAKRHYSKDPSGIKAEEVDHGVLIKKLLTEYDGFALSASSPSLWQILMMVHGTDLKHKKNPDVRIGAWVKPHCSWKPWNAVAYTWEPVIFRTTRKPDGKTTPRDHVIANSTKQKGTHGAKPDQFCDWIIDLLSNSPQPIDDLFPGSGAFSKTVARRVA